MRQVGLRQPDAWGRHGGQRCVLSIDGAELAVKYRDQDFGDVPPRSSTVSRRAWGRAPCGHRPAWSYRRSRQLKRTPPCGSVGCTARSCSSAGRSLRNDAQPAPAVERVLRRRLVARWPARHHREWARDTNEALFPKQQSRRAGQGVRNQSSATLAPLGVRGRSLEVHKVWAAPSAAAEW